MSSSAGAICFLFRKSEVGRSGRDFVIPRLIGGFAARFTPKKKSLLARVGLQSAHDRPNASAPHVHAQRAADARHRRHAAPGVDVGAVDPRHEVRALLLSLLEPDRPHVDRGPPCARGDGSIGSRGRARRRRADDLSRPSHARRRRGDDLGWGFKVAPSTGAPPRSRPPRRESAVAESPRGPRPRRHDSEDRPRRSDRKVLEGPRGRLCDAALLRWHASESLDPERVKDQGNPHPVRAAPTNAIAGDGAAGTSDRSRAETDLDHWPDGPSPATATRTSRRAPVGNKPRPISMLLHLRINMLTCYIRRR